MQLEKLKELQSQFSGNEPLAIVIQYLIEEKENGDSNTDATSGNTENLNRENDNS